MTCATKQENIKICELLLNNEAKIEIKDKYGKTAMDYAQENKIQKIIKSLQEKKKEIYWQQKMEENIKKLENKSDQQIQDEVEEEVQKRMAS